MSARISTPLAAAGVLLSIATTAGAIAGARAIDRALNVDACRAERVAAGVSAADCSLRLPRF